MPFNHRLGLALLVCAFGAAAGCHRAGLFVAPSGSAAASAAPAAMSPDEIVRMRAPRDEIALLNGQRDFVKAADKRPAPVAAQTQADKAAAWKKVLLGVGEFKDWVGYTKAIDDKGRIEIILADGLVVFADAHKDARLFGAVEALRENNQLVVISGRISPSFLGAAAVSDDPRFPTCFENRFGPSGCEIEMTEIAPLR